MLRSVLFLWALLPAGVGALLAQVASAKQQPPAAAPPTSRSVLSVCVDPTNLPYADIHTPGYENKIAELLAADMHADLQYTWNRPYRNFLKGTLLSHACDVVISVPTGLPGIAVTRPYFTSSYVAVTRAADPRHFTSFDDPWLKNAHIGVELIGLGDVQSPPADSLASRGIQQHITGFAMRTDIDSPSPQGRIIDAVASGKIDVAFAWGPIAGYFAKLHGNALKIENVTADLKNPGFTFVYPFSVGVRQDDTALRDRLQRAIDSHAGEIATILADYAIPTLKAPERHAQSLVSMVAQKVASSPSSH